MPIALTDFTAALETGHVLLEWTTATETNNDYFTPERSLDGMSFDALGTVAGAGTSSSEQSYSFPDYDYSDGNNYYRLKQTDIDGKYTYSDVRTVYVNPADDSALTVQPTIVERGASIVASGFNERVSYRASFISVEGKVYSSVTLDGGSSYTLQVPDAAGVFVLRVSWAGDEATMKVLVK